MAAPRIGTAAEARSVGAPITIWLGIAWIGTPWPLRLWWRARHGIPLRDWEGCGCVLRLRMLADWLIARLRRRAAA